MKWIAEVNGQIIGNDSFDSEEELMAEIQRTLKDTQLAQSYGISDGDIIELYTRKKRLEVIITDIDVVELE